MRYFSIFFFVLLAGCSSIPKPPKHPPMPRGDWQQINPAGFVPPKTALYRRIDGVDSSYDAPMLYEEPPEYPNANTVVVEPFKRDENVR